MVRKFLIGGVFGLLTVASLGAFSEASAQSNKLWINAFNGTWSVKFRETVSRVECPGWLVPPRDTYGISGAGSEAGAKLVDRNSVLARVKYPNTAAGSTKAGSEVGDIKGAVLMMHRTRRLNSKRTVEFTYKFENGFGSLLAGPRGPKATVTAVIKDELGRERCIDTYVAQMTRR